MAGIRKRAAPSNVRNCPGETRWFVPTTDSLSLTRIPIVYKMTVCTTLHHFWRSHSAQKHKKVFILANNFGGWTLSVSSGFIRGAIREVSPGRFGGNAHLPCLRNRLFDRRIRAGLP